MSRPLGVVILQVGGDLLDQLILVRTVRVQPEQHRHPGIPSTGDGQLDPVTDRCVLDDAHAPDVAGFHVLRQQHLTGGEVHDVGDAVLGNLEGLVV